ncbi:hypothetical protein DFH07DRAFT_960433 [Mycena maculata]|uniref:Uncharacterized protein n=1 Tax=Mycena maculata TaxID=230809 RepID=A0AAD7J205_9AGAR|nr:hypothetical protein DFH07DRAFT_960433 [Mycena maculata]
MRFTPFSVPPCAPRAPNAAVLSAPVGGDAVSTVPVLGGGLIPILLSLHPPSLYPPPSPPLPCLRPPPLLSSVHALPSPTLQRPCCYFTLAVFHAHPTGHRRRRYRFMPPSPSTAAPLSSTRTSRRPSVCTPRRLRILRAHALPPPLCLPPHRRRPPPSNRSPRDSSARRRVRRGVPHVLPASVSLCVRPRAAFAAAPFPFCCIRGVHPRSGFVPRCSGTFRFVGTSRFAASTLAPAAFVLLAAAPVPFCYRCLRAGSVAHRTARSTLGLCAIAQIGCAWSVLADPPSPPPCSVHELAKGGPVLFNSVIYRAGVDPKGK